MSNTDGAGGTGGGAPAGGAGGNQPPGGTGGAPGGVPATGGAPTGSAPPVAPWGTDANRPWTLQDKPWYDAVIPEGPTRELLKAKNYANPQVLADAYFALNKSYAEDKSRVNIPGPDAKPEDWAAFNKKLGAVEGPDKVDFGFGPDVQVDPKFVDFGKNLSVKLGLRPAQAKLLGQEWNGFVGKLNAETVAAEASKNDVALQELKRNVGDQFDSFRTQGSRVLQALQANNKNPAMRMTEADFVAVEKSIGSAALVKLLASIGSLSGEAAFVTGAPGGGAPGSPEAMSQDQAVAEIDRLRTDTVFQKAYTTAHDPGHKDAVEKMSRLYARAGNKIKQ